ncbi:zinc finger protein 54-like isoform X2 [Cheilinus undulatus]|uniref:zinc finger protein 54-like isoform X2 n=1 Tax=Cheilinus undulatus TaxID=241271 RepID=UPI001BD4C2D8|nr:zinc finger protein 54-like isoform X2 [Cheilinus undulatus]
MSSRLSLNSQLSSIMETMARSALLEVCKLVDQDSAGLRSELCQLQAANSALAEKVTSLECELTIVRSDSRKMGKSSRSIGIQTVCYTDASASPTIEAIFGKDWCINLWKDRDPNSSDRLITESQKIIDKSVTPPSDQATVTDIKEKDCVEDAASSCQHETVSKKDCGESMVGEPEQSSVGYSGVSSSSSLSFDQDGEKDVSEEHCLQLVSIDNAEESLSAHVISIDENNDDDDDVQFIHESQQEPRMNAVGGSIYKQQNSENSAFNKGLPFDLNMINFETVRDPNQDKFTCGICNKTFFHKSTLTLHIKTHNENFCSICRQFFPHISDYNTHTCVPLYSSKTLSCELCGKAFANPSALRIHSVVHTGEKPFRCSFCGKGFTQKGNLNCHLRIHTGERPFCCVKCGKSFTQKVNLKHHMMSHRKSEEIRRSEIGLPKSLAVMSHAPCPDNTGLEMGGLGSSLTLGTLPHVIPHSLVSDSINSSSSIKA